jgi:hypothetical protein
VWQALYSELRHSGFVVIAVALETRGPDAARPWIESAKAAYPCLVDTAHTLSALYGMLNVPTAAWIDEDGRFARPPESAGTTDAFREMDRTTYAIPAAALQELQAHRRGYLEAIKDWVRNGASSRFVLGEREIRARLAPPDDARERAAACALMGDFLQRTGRPEAGQRYFAEASRLQPDSWSYRRQAWNLEDPLKSGGPEFWAAVDALGERRYYPPSGIPPSQGAPSERSGE